VWLGTATAAFSLWLSPLPHSLSASWANHDRVPRARLLRQLAADIPPQASLVVQNNLGGHLAQRKLVSRYPRRWEWADFGLFHLRHVAGPDNGLYVRTNFAMLAGAPAEELLAQVEGLLSSPAWTLVRQSDGFYLFRRRPGHTSASAWLAFRRDAAVLRAQLQQAEQQRAPWARYLAGPLSWSDLARLLGGHG
jgi:hypothetical protein